MADEFALQGFKQWDDAVLEIGGTVRDVTRIRFFLGRHGPFERSYDRGVDTGAIERAITDKRAELQRLSQS